MSYVSKNQTPALIPAVCLVLGSWLAPRLEFLPTVAVVALLALAWTLPGPAARGLVAVSLGLLNVAVREPTTTLEVWLAPARPVEIVGQIASHPILRQDRWLVRLDGDRLRQGRRLRVGSVEVWLSLPAEEPAPAYGTRVRLRGYLRPSGSYANDLELGRPSIWRMRLESRRFLTVEAPPTVLWSRIADFRRLAQDQLPADIQRWRSAALVQALVLGDRSTLPEPWLQALRRSGLAHLLAVSGLHVGLVALCAFTAASPLPPRLRLLLAATAVLFYLALIGPQPAALRAAAMGTLAAAALLCERPPQAINALACSVLVLVGWDPSIVDEIGFQLSVAATAGILMGAPALSRRWTRWPKWLRQSLAVSIAAQAATLPWTLALSSGLHPLAVVLNLFFVPWLTCFLVAGLLWMLVAALSDVAGILLLPVLEMLVNPVDILVSLPPARVWRFPFAYQPWLVWSLAAAVLLWRWRPRVAGRIALMLALLSTAGSGRPRRLPDLVEVLAIDVGQGDAILLRDGGRAALIDGGGWPSGDLGGRILMPVLTAAGVDRLDAVVLTHPDGDHCEGLVDLARYLPIAELWMGTGWAEHSCAARLLTTPGKRWRVLWRGQRAEVGRWRVEVLHPAAANGGRSRVKDNDRSLVLAATVFGRRVLLAGDLEAAGEAALVRAAGGGGGVRADVLKIAHHGSRTSTSPSFLAAVDPSWALISAGRRNPYGHPAPEVLSRLEKAGVRVLRTDHLGLIRLRFHPEGRISYTSATKSLFRPRPSE